MVVIETLGEEGGRSRNKGDKIDESYEKEGRGD